MLTIGKKTLAKILLPALILTIKCLTSTFHVTFVTVIYIIIATYSTTVPIQNWYRSINFKIFLFLIDKPIKCWNLEWTSDNYGNLFQICLAYWGQFFMHSITDASNFQTAQLINKYMVANNFILKMMKLYFLYLKYETGWNKKC